MDDESVEQRNRKHRQKKKKMTAEELEMKKREDNYVPRVGFYD